MKPTPRTTTASVDQNEHIRAGFWFLGMTLVIEVTGLLVILFASFFMF